MVRRKDITRKTVTITESQMKRCEWMMQEGGYLNFSSLVRTALQYYYEKRYPDYVFRAAKKEVEAKDFDKRVKLDPALNPDAIDVAELTNEQICEQMGGVVEDTKCAIYFTKGQVYSNASGQQLGKVGVKFELTLASEKYMQYIEDKGRFGHMKELGFVSVQDYLRDNPGSPE